MKKTFFFLFVALICSFKIFSQPIDSLKFFTDDQLLHITLTTDIRALQAEKGTPTFLDGTIQIIFPDNNSVSSAIAVAPRGVNRRDYCKVPPMKINFRKDKTSPLASLGSLKLVLGCGTGSADEELLLKEYVCYKLFNMIEDKSFRVRLAKVDYTDTHGRFHPFSQYSFFIEDDGDLARRNNCMKKVHGSYLTEATDRKMMTMVSLFQYMIGNTDWAVPNEHNIKILFDKKSPAIAYAIPYDFDYSGLVDASYAVPNEIIGTESVTERVYRGFPRTMSELQEVLDIYRAKKDNMVDYIRNFSELSEKTRKTMVSYLDDFFKIIESKGQVQSVFIDNARKQ
jgi:hypothetical protein